MLGLFKSKTTSQDPTESALPVPAETELTAFVERPRHKPDVYVARPELGPDPGSPQPSMREAYLASGAPGSASRLLLAGGILRERVRSILTWHDPMDLAVGGTYNAEAERILGALDQVGSEEELVVLVSAILREMFPAAQPRPDSASAEIARDIWRACRSA
jgi:hypothetical protein